MFCSILAYFHECDHVVVVFQMVLDCLRVVVDTFEAVVEFWEVGVDGCRWFQVVPRFSNYAVGLHNIIIFVDCR